VLNCQWKNTIQFLLLDPEPAGRIRDGSFAFMNTLKAKTMNLMSGPWVSVARSLTRIALSEH
jgi:hypothetical protein